MINKSQGRLFRDSIRTEVNTRRLQNDSKPEEEGDPAGEFRLT